ncbi:MAG: exosortase family protein XrtG [Syntrophomonadaceae bacterium]|nr:exosortase family protein XrtG [Syntrophomonadaceae bacterium]
MRIFYITAGCIAAAVFIWLWPRGILLAPDCRLDGRFEDWTGQAGLAVSRKDAADYNGINRISWNTNTNDSNLYFMIERDVPEQQEKSLEFLLFFDINANGNYEDAVDKYAEISYLPLRGKGKVKVYLCSVKGEVLSEYTGMWGEGFERGANRLEFAIPMEDLHIYPAQTIRFFLCGSGDDLTRLPGKGDIQWRPFPVVLKDKLLITGICLVWLAMVFFFYYNKIWVLYYICGSVGLCCILVLLSRGSYIEYFLARQTSSILHYLLSCFGIVTYIFDRAPGTLLVLIKVDASWTTITMDIENSGLLELCIFGGLILFYPLYRLAKKGLAAVVGLAGIYAANIIRLFVVILLINRFGRDMGYIAHTLIGRVLFFFLVVAVYWNLFTRFSLKYIRKKVEDA